MTKKKIITVATDTATLAIFDPQAARSYVNHQYHDWWTMWECALPAINAGDLAIIDLGSDGLYDVELVESSQIPNTGRLEINLRSPSGTLYVGPGEDIPAGGLELDESSQGKFIEIGAGTVRCVLCRINENTVLLALVNTDHDPINNFEEPTRLNDY